MGRWLIGFLILAPAAAPALTMWASNIDQVPKAYRLVLVVAAFALLGLIVFWLIRSTVSDSRVAALLSFFVLLTLTSGGQLLNDRPWIWRWGAAIVIVALVGVIVFRLREWWLIDVVVVGAAAALLIPPLITGVSGYLNSPNPRSISTDDPLPAMTGESDVVLVVMDAYTSLPVLKTLFGFEDETLRADLAADGFRVVEPVFSPYPMTQLAVSSLLELDYVADGPPATETADGKALADVIGGESHLVSLLAQSGYQIRMVEPGWHMSTCGAPVDTCVSDPFIDEGVGAVLSQSLLWAFIEPSVGSASINGARHAMSWTTDNLDEFAKNQIPDFVFIHVLAPRPPLFLDGDCEIVSSRRRLGGENMSIDGVDPITAQLRLDGYVDQVRCANLFLREVADSFSNNDALVFITGDHGSDALSQLVTNPDRWTDAQILERMSVFVAVKAPIRCETESSLVTVALFRSLVSCVGNLDLEPIGERAFLVSLSENGEDVNMRTLGADDVEALSGCLLQVEETLSCP